MYPLLSGLTIIEASSFVASPTAGLYLAQLGARVIRVDQVGGGPDFNRWPQAANGRSLFWENLNRGKESVAIDFTKSEGRTLMQRLVASAGLFVTNFPATGFLAHDTLAALNDQLISVRISGTHDGRTALDYTVNAAVGYPFLTGEGPGPVNHVLPAWDLLTGAYASFALLAALRHRDAGGGGQEVRIPLQDVALASAANLGMFAEVYHHGTTRERLGNQVYGAFGRDFETADGVRVMLMAITPRQWAGLIDVLDMAAEVAAIEAMRDASFAQDEGARFAHRDLIYPMVEAKVAQWRFDDLIAALDRVGGCYGTYKSVIEAANDPTLVHDNPLFGISANASGLAYPAPGSFASLSKTERGPPQPAPLLGADSDAVLGEFLGISDSELAALHRAGVVSRA
jgi:2-methylfumaryl-CoA isomerase